MAKNKGYIILSRSLQDHWLWTDVEPFDHRAAWVDLLMMANHEDRKVGEYGSFRTIQRGQIKTSIDHLRRRWRWSENKVKRFLKNLVCDGMITTDGFTRGTVITLVNYDKIQGQWRTKGATDGPTNEPTGEWTDGGTGGPQTMNYKELKRTKKEEKRSSAPNPILEPEEEEEAWQ